MLQSRIEALRVLAHDDEIDIRIAGWNVRQVPDGPEVRIKLKFLAQRNVDAGEAAADGRSHRALQTHMCALDRFDRFFWDVLTVFLECFGSDLK